MANANLSGYMVSDNLKDGMTPAGRMMQNAERIMDFNHKNLYSMTETWLRIVHHHTYCSGNVPTYVRERKTVCWFWELIQ